MIATPRTAVLVGATGLVGRALLGQLLAEPRFSSVTVLGRRSAGVADAKLAEHVIDFDEPEAWAARAVGDVLFSALGTTVKAAGSQAAQRTVDYTYQLRVAEAARRNGADTYVLVSSAGAAPGSSLFYTRMKGELERATEALGFKRTRFLQPGPLDGDRQEHRAGERWMLRFLRPLSPLLPPVARPIRASIVARAAIAAACDPTPGVLRLDAGRLFDLG